MLTGLACTIRRTSLTTWEIVSDSDHEPLNAASVAIVTSGSQKFLRLTYAFTAAKIHSSHVTLDEGFAACVPAIRVGQSVGMTHMDIYLYEGTSSAPVDPGLYSKAGANLWVSGLFTVAE